MKTLLLVSSLLLALAPSAFADTITFSQSVGGAATGSTRLNLDNLALGAGVQWADANVKVSFVGDGGVVKNAVANQYAAPFLSGSNGAGFGSQVAGADTTHYLSSGIGSVVLDFSSHQTYFGLLWGSVDNYNTLSFYDNGALVGSFSGANIWGAANGDQGQQGTFYVNFTDLDGSFNQVVASSTNYAFELDNIAYSNGNNRVPDSGATVALLGAALAGMVALRRRKL
jgi:hypothetical protein